MSGKKKPSEHQNHQGSTQNQNLHFGCSKFCQPHKGKWMVVLLARIGRREATMVEISSNSPQACCSPSLFSLLSLDKIHTHHIQKGLQEMDICIGCYLGQNLLPPNGPKPMSKWPNNRKNLT